MDWIEEIRSAWKGHRRFAEVMANYFKNPVIVELGVDYGYSAFCFANALTHKDGKVYGVDKFEGDEHAGIRDTYDFVKDIIAARKIKNLHIIKGDFQEVAITWNTKIDILHIDGFHTFEAVQSDFTSWYPHLKEGGVVLFHDTAIESFGIKTFFDTLTDGYKLNFTHSAGLGIYTKNKDLYDFILSNFDVR